MGKEGNSHLNSITCSFLLILTTFSPSWGDISSIHHCRALFQSPKVTRNAIKIIRSCLAGHFFGERGEQSSEIYHLFSTPDFPLSLFPLLGWCITHSSPQGSPSEPQNGQKCHQDNRILLTRPFHKERGGQLPGKSITCQVLLICPTSPLSWGGASPIHHTRGPFQSPNVTINATKMTNFVLPAFEC